MNDFERLGTEQLTAAGWREGRRVNVDKARQAYLEERYEWPPFVDSLLTEFSGMIFGKPFGPSETS